MQKHGFLRLLLVGATALLMSSCLPEDEAILSEREARNIEAQVEMYAQAFQQYSNQSLNALTSSAVWAAQTIPEGLIDLSSSGFGGLSVGNSENYLQSAYCMIDGDAYHLTWFEAQSNDGELSLMGLGSAYSNAATVKAKEYIPNENFAVFDGDGLNFSGNNTSKSLVGACASLGIPKGSAVAAYKLSTPDNIALAQEKTILRASSCGAGQQGAITERINATFTQDGYVLIGSNQYSSESEAIASHSTGWSEVANDCITVVAGLERQILNTTTNAINAANVDGLDGEIKTALLSNLEAMDCRQLNASGNIDNVQLYETCKNELGNVNPLDGVDVSEKTFLRQEEEVIISQCPTSINYGGNVTVDTANTLYSGLNGSLNGKPATISSGTITGDVKINKITRFYQVTANYGKGPVTNQIQEIDMVGKDIQCRGTDNLTMSCANAFPIEDSKVIIDKGPRYRSNKSVTEWANANKLIPGSYNRSPWTLTAPIECKYEQVRATSCDTPPERRDGTITGFGAGPDWSDWEVAEDLEPFCRTCDVPVKLTYVLDDSGSVGINNWRKINTYVKQSYKSFKTVKAASIVQFSKGAGVTKSGVSAVESYVKSADNLRYANGGSTRIGKGLDKALEMMSSKAYRDVTDAQNVVILITDGVSSSGFQAPAKQIRDDGAILYVIGIGGYNMGQLKDIAGPGNENRIFTGTDFNQLLTSIGKITEGICDAVGK